MTENGFKLDQVFQELERWLNKTPSQFDLFGLIDNDHKYGFDGWVTEEIQNRLKRYSSTGETLRIDISHSTHIIILDEEELGILFHKHGVFIARNGWRKWVSVVEFLAPNH